MIELIRKSLLFSIGAAVMMKDKGEEVIKKLIEKGEEYTSRDIHKKTP